MFLNASSIELQSFMSRTRIIYSKFMDTFAQNINDATLHYIPEKIGKHINESTTETASWVARIVDLVFLCCHGVCWVLTRDISRT